MRTCILCKTGLIDTAGMLAGKAHSFVTQILDNNLLGSLKHKVKFQIQRLILNIKLFDRQNIFLYTPYTAIRWHQCISDRNSGSSCIAGPSCLRRSNPDTRAGRYCCTCSNFWRTACRPRLRWRHPGSSGSKCRLRDQLLD